MIIKPAPTIIPNSRSIFSRPAKSFGNHRIRMLSGREFLIDEANNQTPTAIPIIPPNTPIVSSI